jgi:DHA1 family bicyclomycin/chloramphenicol resistance-like MFS transporter
LIAMMMALPALSIDLILPAFDDIRGEFGLAADSSETAGIVTVFLLGLALPQLVYGPLSDRFGRKPIIYAGFALFTVGAVGAAISSSLGLILLSRFVWGLGAAAPRVITLSIVRDSYEHERMAQVMSFVMAVFVLVPIVAPSVGAGIISIVPWRGVFWFCVAFMAAIALWAIRLPETLDPANRLDLRWDGIRNAVATVVRNRQTMGYTVALTFLNGVFVSYLASSELIWDDVFDRGDQFPLIFGGLAIVLGSAVLTNGLIVRRVGVLRLVHLVVAGYVVAAFAMLTIALLNDGRPGFWVFLGTLAVPLAMQGLLIPNLNTAAMTPMGKVAGTASAVIGAVSTAFGALLGLIIDRSFDGTVTPLSVAFVTAGVAALITVAITERGKLQIRSRPTDPAAIVPPMVD